MISPSGGGRRAQCVEAAGGDLHVGLHFGGDVRIVGVVISKSGDPTRARTFWQRRVRDPVVAQLTQGITPEKIALTLAVGSTCALFPIVGTTSLLCLVFGILLRLNQPMIQSINVLCTPIHIPLVFFFAHWGQRLFGEPITRFSIKYYASLLWDDPTFFFRKFGGMAFHAAVVWAIFAPFWVFAVYYATVPLLRSIARVRAENAAKLTQQKPPDHPVP